jgi:hypothetical protein
MNDNDERLQKLLSQSQELRALFNKGLDQLIGSNMAGAASSRANDYNYADDERGRSDRLLSNYLNVTRPKIQEIVSKIGGDSTLVLDAIEEQARRRNQRGV